MVKDSHSLASDSFMITVAITLSTTKISTQTMPTTAITTAAMTSNNSCTVNHQLGNLFYPASALKVQEGLSLLQFESPW